MKFQIDSNVTGQYTWRLRADNGYILAVGESYFRKADCAQAIDLVKATLTFDRFTVYRDVRGEWRWNLRAANGEIIAQSSEGYRQRRDCDNAVRWTFSANSATAVEDLTATAVRRW